jgi:hypothetical protein
MGMKGIGMFEIVEMGREDGDGGIGMEITNGARCGVFTGTCHIIHAFSVNDLLPKKDGCGIPHDFNTRNRKNVLQKYK